MQLGACWSQAAACAARVGPEGPLLVAPAATVGRLPAISDAPPWALLPAPCAIESHAVPSGGSTGVLLMAV